MTGSPVPPLADTDESLREAQQRIKNRAIKRILADEQLLGPILIYALGLGIILVLAFLAWRMFAEPAPREILLLTGAQDGAYYQFGQKYKEYLEKQGLRVTVVSTKGSVENLETLRNAEDSKQEVVALVQGGVAAAQDSVELESLSSLMLEPTFVFYRPEAFGGKEVEDLSELTQSRVAIGGQGSGVRGLFLRLVEESGLKFDDSKLVSQGGTAAAEALLEGKVDAAFFVVAPSAKYVRKLLESKQVRLMSYARANAYVRKLPFLREVALTAGMVDLQNNLPDRDYKLIAPTSALVVRKSAHEDLTPLLIEASKQVFGKGGGVEEPGQFPSPHFTDIPVSDRATKYFAKGPSFLNQFLPYWITSQLDWVSVVLLPLMTLLYTVFRVPVMLMTFRAKAKLSSWYRAIREIDHDRRKATLEELENHHEAIRAIDRYISSIKMPSDLMVEYYDLRAHLYMVRELLEYEIEKRKKNPVPPGDSPTLPSVPAA